MARGDVRREAQAEDEAQANGQMARGAEDEGQVGAAEPPPPRGRDQVGQAEESAGQPGQPPAQWVERFGPGDPPAHWLQWIRERTSGGPDAELPEFVRVSVPQPPPAARGEPDGEAGLATSEPDLYARPVASRPEAPMPRAPSPLRPV